MKYLRYTVMLGALLLFTAPTYGEKYPDLISAASNGDLAEVKRHLDQGADVSMKTADGWGTTALHFAAEHGYMKIAVLLVEAGADVNAIDDAFGEAPLHKAADYHEANRNVEYLAIAKLLVENGANVNNRNKDGLVPLYFVRFPDIATLLLENNADINSADVDGNTPICLAVVFGREKIVSLFLNMKAVVDVRCWSNSTLDEAAYKIGNIKIIEMLSEYKTQQNSNSDEKE